MASTTYTYDDKAIRESLLPIITNINPVEESLYSSLQKVEAQQPYHQWLTDTLKTTGTNAQVEGADAAYAARTNPTRKANWTQIIREDFQVSGSDRASNTAGFKDRFAYEMQKAMKEYKNEAEFALVRGTLASGTGSAARQLAGIKAQITTNLTSQSGVSLSEQMLNDYLQAAWSQGGAVNKVLVGGRLKRRISQFSTANTRQIAADSQKVVASIDVYVSDFGPVEVALHRFVTGDNDVNFDVLGLQTDKWAVAHLTGREPKYTELAQTGDATKGMVLGEFTAVGLAENSSFLATKHL